jgi:trimeric autotransporter adhesin
MRIAVILAGFACLALAPGVSFAQCPAQWASDPSVGVPGTSGAVLAVGEFDSDGSGPQPPSLILAGVFQSVSNTPASRIVRYDGSSWHTLGSGVTGGTVQRVFASNGQLVVAGDFTSAGGAPETRNLARWDGSAWSGFSGVINGVVVDACVYNGDLHIAGQFSQLGSLATRGVARWDGSAWQPVGGGVTASMTSARVDALVVHDNKLIAGGRFEQAGGVPASNIASWDGSAWQPIGPGFTRGIQTLASYQGELYAATSSTSGTPQGQFWKWNGLEWTLDLQATLDVTDAVVFGDDLVVLGGGFARKRSGVWSTQSWGGRSLGAWLGNPVVGPSAATCGAATIVIDDQRVPIQPDGVFTPFVAQVDAESPDSVYVNAGPCSPTGNLPPAVWNGQSWTTLPFPGTNLGALAWIDDAVWAAYRVTALTGDTGRLGRFVDGAWQDMAVLPRISLGTPPTVQEIGSFRDGVALFGNFPVTAGRFATWWNGTSFQNLSANLPEATQVWDTIEYDGSLIIAGSINLSESGVFRRNIARWTGQRWEPMGAGVNGVPYQLEEYRGELYLGGSFTQTGTAPARGLARWTGTAWTEVGGGITGATAIRNVGAMHNFNGALWIAGSFRQVGAQTTDGLAAWNGASWQTFPQGPVDRNGVAVDLSAGLSDVAGELTISGPFDMIEGGAISHRWARYTPAGPRVIEQPSDQTLCQGQTLTLRARTSSPDATFQWRFEGQEIPGAQQPDLIISNVAVTDAGWYDCVITAPSCGQQLTTDASIIVLAHCALPCDPIDFNGDGSRFDPLDIEAFFSVFSEGPCLPAGAVCGDVDFNNDGSFYDPEDFDSFLSVFSEGPCVP